MPKTVKTIWNIVTWTLVVLVVVFALMLVGVRLIGIQAYTVLSGSMEPTYHVGSLIYVDAAKNDTERAQYKVGDPITYMKDKDTVVTHRIIGVDVVPLTDVEKASGDYTGDTKTLYLTKGDANDTVDAGPGTNSKNVIGKPVFSIPFLGYVANYVQSPPGIYVAGAACVVVILLAFLPDILFPEEKSVTVSGQTATVVGKQKSKDDGDGEEDNSNDVGPTPLGQ